MADTIERPATVGAFTIVTGDRRARRESHPQLTLTVQGTGSTSARLSQAALALLWETYGANPKVLIGAANGQVAVLVHKDGNKLADSGSLSGPDVFAAMGKPADAGVYVMPLVGEKSIRGLVGHVTNAKRKDIRIRPEKPAPTVAA